MAKVSYKAQPSTDLGQQPAMAGNKKGWSKQLHYLCLGFAITHCVWVFVYVCVCIGNVCTFCGYTPTSAILGHMSTVQGMETALGRSMIQGIATFVGVASVLGMVGDNSGDGG